MDLRGDVLRQVKPVLHRGGASRWSVGANYLLGGDRRAWPCFTAAGGRLTGPMRVASQSMQDTLTVRALLPAGYDENTLKRYPVLYATDGGNLFDPGDSFGGREWGVDETTSLLDQMSVIDKVIVVGVSSRGALRNQDYTKPGWDATLGFFTDELVPKVDAAFRTLANPADRAILGSSLGGVFSLHAFWSRRDVFGAAASMSSTFGYADDLFARVARDPLPDGRLYLDSGYPRDNFEAVRRMAGALAERGMGTRLRYVAHPRGLHGEAWWAERLHLPLEFLFGRL